MKQSKLIRLVFLVPLLFLMLAACSPRNESAGPLSVLPKEALNALNQRVKSDFGLSEYTAVTAQKSASGASWCIVFDPPLEGQLMGQSILYDYAVIQPDGNSWNAMMIEDHQNGLVLKMFGCDAFYKE